MVTLFNTRSEVTGSNAPGAQNCIQTIQLGKRKKVGLPVEKTSRKKLTAVAFGGRQVTKTKAQQNYIPRHVAGGQTNVL